MKKVNLESLRLPNYERRTCFSDLERFIENEKNLEGEYLILFGLRRTGKTTLMEQICQKYGASRCEYFICDEDTTMDDVTRAIEESQMNGKDIILIDEITDVIDFQYRSSELANIYAKEGLNIIVAGTDSLGVVLSKYEDSYGRIFNVPTTYVPFSEHCNVLHTKDMDNYIRYGGLMRQGVEPNDAIINDLKSAKRYLDEAVADNIARSLNKSASAAEYLELSKYEKPDLRLFIEKIVELYSGKFEFPLLNKELKKTSITAPIRDMIRSLKKKQDEEELIRYKAIDQSMLNSEYRDILNLSCPAKLPATEELVKELKDVLIDLNLLSVTGTYHFRKENGIWLNPESGYEYHIVQPAIKYYHLKEAVKILKNSPVLQDFTIMEREMLSEQLENDILGRMTESIVLFDVGKLLDKDRYLVCKPYFEGEQKGEYDLLIYDRKNQNYYGFEVKHTSEPYLGYNDEVYNGQDKHLINPDFTQIIDKNFGKREHVCVLYNGNPFEAPTGTAYLNVTDFLLSINETRDIIKTMTDLTEHLEKKNCTCIQNIPIQTNFLEEQETEHC